jgi:hypothetical protein
MGCQRSRPGGSRYLAALVPRRSGTARAAFFELVDSARRTGAFQHDARAACEGVHAADNGQHPIDSDDHPQRQDRWCCDRSQSHQERQFRQCRAVAIYVRLGSFATRPARVSRPSDVRCAPKATALGSAGKCRDGPHPDSRRAAKIKGEPVSLRPPARYAPLIEGVRIAAPKTRGSS